MIDRRSRGQHTVPLRRIRDGIAEMVKLPTSFSVPPPTQRHLDCYLEYEQGSPCRVVGLGPLSRWLIAIDLLTADKDPSSKIHEHVGIKDRKGVGQKTAKRLFGGRSKTDRLLKEAQRYTAQDTKATDKTDRRVAEFNAKVIADLNLRFGRQRGSPIEIDDFLAVRTPVGAHGSLGAEPLEWFKSWIKFGSGTAVRSKAATPSGVSAPTVGEFSKDWDTLTDALVGSQLRVLEDPSVGQDEGSHQHIINVHSPRTPGQLANFAVDVQRSIEGLASPDQLKVHKVSLRTGITRLRLLEQLYEIFGIDTAPLESIRSGERSVDLDTDVEPVRKALTVNRIVIIFEGWEVVQGPFQVLHEYLSRTNWGELLAILAQPHFPTLRATDGGVRPTYQLLVLSSAKVKELTPWSQDWPLGALWSLRGDFSEVPAELKTLHDDNRLSSAELQLAEQMAPAHREAWILETKRRDPSVSKAGGELHAMERLIDRCALTELETLCLCLIAASVTGMRRSTLRRCMFEWGAMFGGQKEASLVRLAIDSALEKFRGVVAEVDDEEVESLSMAQIDYELDREPIAVTDRDVSPAVVVFASAVLRAVFVRVWRASEANDPGRPLLTRRYEHCSWAHVNFVLAEESIRQATSQFRHRPSDSPTSSYSLCRAVQGLLHALGSLALSTSQFKGGTAIAGGLYGPALPVDAPKRLRYLYSFLYRRIIEGDDWRLGRGFGRSDLRLDLLILLVQPELASQVIAPTGVSAVDLWKTLEKVQFEGLGSGTAGSQRKVVVTNKAIWCDLVEAIGRAGCDLGGARGEAAVEWALARMPHNNAGPTIAKSIPRKAIERVSIAAIKLRIDWYQSRGQQDKLADAEALCRAKLRDLGIDDVKIFDGIFETADKALELARAGMGKVRTTMQEMFNEVQQSVERETKDDMGQRKLASELLFRLGEVFATRADNIDMIAAAGELADIKPAKEGEGDDEDADPARSFARALAVYWIADRLRSSVCLIDGDDLDWPSASSRSMRYYVRVILKLARLLGREQRVDGDVLGRMSTQLLEQAQNRIGVYSRHNFQFRRERESMLCLEAGRLRVWARVLLARALLRGNGNGKGDEDSLSVRSVQSEMAPLSSAETLNLCDQLMEQCWSLLDQAEQLLFSLGFQTAHVRRLLLERVKGASAVITVATARLHAKETGGREDEARVERRVVAFLRHARASLDALSAASDKHDFWGHIVKRQESRLIEVTQAWNKVAPRV